MTAPHPMFHDVCARARELLGQLGETKGRYDPAGKAGLRTAAKDEALDMLTAWGVPVPLRLLLAELLADSRAKGTEPDYSAAMLVAARIEAERALPPDPEPQHPSDMTPQEILKALEAEAERQRRDSWETPEGRVSWPMAVPCLNTFKKMRRTPGYWRVVMDYRQERDGYWEPYPLARTLGLAEAQRHEAKMLVEASKGVNTSSVD